MWRFSFFFQFWLPRLDYCESASKQPWNALQCVFSKSNHKTLFFCLSRQPFFVNESLCCCCCAKVSPMYLYIEIGVYLWGTFGILCLSVGFTWGAKFSNISLTGPVESNTAGMGQFSNLWKKNGMGLFKRVRQSEIGERDEREGWRGQEANEWKQWKR